MEKNKTGKYFKYAIGEIVLVVIGILIALQINNWNTNRIEHNTIKNYYERIIVELDQETNQAMSLKVKIESSIHKNKRVLKIINSKNTDSINVIKNLLGNTATYLVTDYHFPITKEFISQNYLSKIKNDSIKMDFEYLSSLFSYSASALNYYNSQYVNTIEPFFIKNINYSEVALPQWRKGLIQGGPIINYESLFTSLELWNIVTFKLESLNGESLKLEESIEKFKIIKERLQIELDN